MHMLTHSLERRGIIRENRDLPAIQCDTTLVITTLWTVDIQCGAVDVAQTMQICRTTTERNSSRLEMVR